MKSQISSILCLLVLVAACNTSLSEARPKRSVIYTAAAAPLVASVPVVQTHVVHSNPTSVVKTEQVRSGDHASYSYTSEVKNEPVVHTHTHAAPVAAAAVHAAPVVATHHTVAAAAVPAAYHYGYYPTAYSYSSPYSYYSPYSYVIGK